MKIDNMKRLVMKNRQHGISKIIIRSCKYLLDFSLFACTVIGYIPSHTIRYVLYKYIFKVKIEKDSIIYWRCRFFSPWGVNIGHSSIIGNDAFLDGRDGLFIGNNVNIVGECRIYTKEHDIGSQSFSATGAPVHIGDFVYIGTRVTILPGVTVGEGAVLASGSVVTKNVDSWTMVGGVPAKFIKQRPLVKYTLNTKNKVLFQ